MSAMNMLSSLSVFWKMKDNNFLSSCIFAFPTIYCVTAEFGVGVAEHLVSLDYSSKVFYLFATNII